MNLGRVERHHEDRHARSQQGAKAGRIAANVPLRRRWLLLISGRFVVVSPTDAAAHHHNALQFAEGGWVARNRRLLVEQRTDGDEGDLPGMRANLTEQKANSVPILAIGLLARICGLREVIRRLSGDACFDRKVFPAHCREVTIDEASAQFGIAKGRGDAEEFDLRAAQQKSQRKRIVDVVANVGVDNDELLDFGVLDWPLLLAARAPI